MKTLKADKKKYSEKADSLHLSQVRGMFSKSSKPHARPPTADDGARFKHEYHLFLFLLIPSSQNRFHSKTKLEAEVEYKTRSYSLVWLNSVTLIHERV